MAVRRGRGQSQRKTSAAKASKAFEIVDRRRRVALLMRAGWQQQEIAGELGYSDATISGDVATIKAGMRAVAQEVVEEMMAEELGALDGDEAVLREMMGRATLAEYVRLQELLLQLQVRRAQLAGLDEVSRRRAGEQQQRGGGSLDALLAALDEVS